jgi:hypothetical protein
MTSWTPLSVATHFGGTAPNPTQFAAELAAADPFPLAGLQPGCVTGLAYDAVDDAWYTDADAVQVPSDTTPVASELADLVALAAAHDPASLTVQQAAKQRALSVSFTTMIYVHYGAAQQSSLAVYLDAARAAGLTNRIAYIDQVRAWVDAGLTAYYALQDEIEAASTQAGLDAVTWDWTAHEATDPLVTLRAARGIPD